MATTNDKGHASHSEELAYAMAGLIDMAAYRVMGVAREVQGLLRRSDLGLLVGEGRADLLSRGELALRRRAHMPEAHLDTLARRAVAQRGADADA
jgi:hypothetical protein